LEARLPHRWHEYGNISRKPTGKTTRFVRSSDRGVVGKTTKNTQGRHICGQILRSGTTAAANYGEARGAESRADFIHKLKVVFKD